MRFNPTLIRAILDELEASDDADGSEALILTIPGHTESEISYHVRLLAERGLVTAREAGGVSKPLRLTWTGHDALEAIRQDVEAAAIEAASDTVAEQGAIEHGLPALPRGETSSETGQDDWPPLVARHQGEEA